jgi:hypothetical protein
MAIFLPPALIEFDRRQQQTPDDRRRNHGKNSAAIIILWPAFLLDCNFCCHNPHFGWRYFSIAIPTAIIILWQEKTCSIAISAATTHILAGVSS